jgi:hypothetical protein
METFYGLSGFDERHKLAHAWSSALEHLQHESASLTPRRLPTKVQAG